MLKLAAGHNIILIKNVNTLVHLKYYTNRNIQGTKFCRFIKNCFWQKIFSDGDVLDGDALDGMLNSESYAAPFAHNIMSQKSVD